MVWHPLTVGGTRPPATLTVYVDAYVGVPRLGRTPDRSQTGGYTRGIRVDPNRGSRRVGVELPTKRVTGGTGQESVVAWKLVPHTGFLVSRLMRLSYVHGGPSRDT